MRLSTHMDTLLQNLASRGYVPQSSLASVLQDLGSRRRDPLLGLGAVNPLLQPEQEGGGEGEAEVFSGSVPVLEEKDAAGDLLLAGDNPLEIMGAAVVARERVVGTLSPRECVVFHHLQTKGRLGCAIREDGLQLQIRLAPADLSETILQEGRQLMQKLQALGSDPLGFANVSAHSFWTDGEWEAYGFGSVIPRRMCISGRKKAPGPLCNPITYCLFVIPLPGVDLGGPVELLQQQHRASWWGKVRRLMLMRSSRRFSTSSWSPKDPR